MPTYEWVSNFSGEKIKIFSEKQNTELGEKNTTKNEITKIYMRCFINKHLQCLDAQMLNNKKKEDLNWNYKLRVLMSFMTLMKMEICLTTKLVSGKIQLLSLHINEFLPKKLIEWTWTFFGKKIQLYFFFITVGEKKNTIFSRFEWVSGLLLYREKKIRYLWCCQGILHQIRIQVEELS